MKDKMRKWKEYSQMSDLAEIARRKFFNNCFDGALTCAGIISGMFILFLDKPTLFVPSNVIITGFATAIAIGISGIWGAFLSEEAERTKKVLDLKKEMVIIEEEGEQEAEKENHEKTIIEKAEKFATIVASLVDGLAPVLGSSLPLIPFFFGTSLTLMHFVSSYMILIGLLIYLGIYLGNISGGKRFKYAANLVTAGIVTLIISLILGQITG